MGGFTRLAAATQRDARLAPLPSLRAEKVRQLARAGASASSLLTDHDDGLQPPACFKSAGDLIADGHAAKMPRL